MMVSSDSIWIDEAQTWTYASLGSVSDLFQELATDTKSEAQMPLGMLAAWAWAKVGGTSEWALRAPNMIYALGAILVFFRLGKKLAQPWLPFFFAIQPFLWFYVNEARPYSMQIFGGSLLLAGLIEVVSGKRDGWAWLGLWASGSFITAGASMLGGIPVAVGTLLIVILFLIKKTLPSRNQVLAFLACSAGLGILAAYYVTTLLRGSGGAKIWALGPQNLVFSAVEFLGVTGFLPPRQVLREIVRNSDLATLLSTFGVLPSILLALMLLCWAVILFHTIRNIKNLPAWTPLIAAYFLASILLLAIAAAIVGFPFWGRHLAPLFPAFVLILGLGLRPVGANYRAFVQSTAIVLCVLLLLSSLSLRFSPKFSKDDYRAAAYVAAKTMEEGGPVWWAADLAAAKYYGANPEFYPDENQTQESPTPSSSTGSIFLTNGSTSEYLAGLPRPSVIVLSKTDIYDSAGHLQAWIKDNKYVETTTLQSFQIFRAEEQHGQ